MAKRRKRRSTMGSLASKAISASFLLNAKRMFSDMLDDLQDRIEETKKRVARDLGIFFLAELGALSIFISIILFVKERWQLEYWTSFLLVGLVSIVVALLLKNQSRTRR